MPKTPKVTPKWPSSVPKVSQSASRVTPKCCKYVYYPYRWLPWTTWTMYPTSCWWHLHVCDTMLVTFWRIRHDFNRFVLHAGITFSLFVWKCAPRLHRKHNSRWRHKAFLIKKKTKIRSFYKKSYKSYLFRHKRSFWPRIPLRNRSKMIDLRL